MTVTRARSLSPVARMVLAALLQRADQWSYGYDLAKVAGVKSGTLYPLLIRLEQGGFLEAEWQPPTGPGRPPRHAYRLTADGLELARRNPVQNPHASAAPLREART